MKKFIFLLLLTNLTACHKTQLKPNEPELATVVSGDYQLIKASYMGNNIISTYKAQLSVSKIDANHVNADFSFSPPVSPFTESWQLRKIASDTIEIRQVGTVGTTGLYTLYEKGQISLSLADASLQLRFKKIE
jgi:hypothetical protein